MVSNAVNNELYLHINSASNSLTGTLLFHLETPVTSYKRLLATAFVCTRSNIYLYTPGLINCWTRLVLLTSSYIPTDTKEVSDNNITHNRMECRRSQQYQPSTDDQPKGKNLFSVELYIFFFLLTTLLNNKYSDWEPLISEYIRYESEVWGMWWYYDAN